MKVLLIDVNCKGSSTGKIVYDLYTAVNESGNEAAICYGRGEKITERNILKFGIDLETYAHALLTRLTGYTGCFSPFSTHRLIKFIKKFKPDVVHIHELHAYFVNIKPLINYLKKSGIKTVMTLHCEFAYTGKCGHSIECEKWKSECHSCPHLRDYPKSMLFDHTKAMFRQKKKLFEDFDNLTVVTPSQWLAERTKQSFLGSKDVRVIHNGIDTDIFSPKDTSELKAKHHISDDEKVVLAVAPDLMSDAKGGRHVVETAKRFAGQNARFILVGVEDLTEQFPENVTALGKIKDQNELAKYYSLADVFVICSQRETFSLTCAETLCCGSALVGFRSGAPESIFVGKYAKWVEYGNIDALCNEITNMLKNKIPANAISEEAIKLYSKQTMFDSYMKLYY